MDKSYTALFELLWYSQIPCFDVENVTSYKEGYGIRTEIRVLLTSLQVFLIGMIKSCVWKGRNLSCASIFSMYPTDRGMCCTFNKQRADEMFQASRYQDEVTKLNSQDKESSFEDSAVPPWLVKFFMYEKFYDLICLLFMDEGMILCPRQESLMVWS